MRLLICAPAPVGEVSGKVRLDTKFVEGMRAHVRDWGGPVLCVLWRGAQDIPFGDLHDPEDLPFDLLVLDQNAALPASAFRGVSVALLSADMPGIGAMAEQLADAGVPCVVVVEYTLSTRLRILWLDRQRTPLRRLKTCLWILRHERALRRAVRGATGVQFNGFPAFDAYAKLNTNTLLYLDNRLAPAMIATADDLQARARRLRAGQPLRLIHSGRFEAMKGVQDLPGLMRMLRAAGVNVTLDVYGAGSLEQVLRRDLEPFGDSVRVHGPVDFETRLVPINRTQADIFVSCHRQQDPSCTYLEAMGCGLAVTGYDNGMWRGLQAASGAGRIARMGNVQALAQTIADWDNDREGLIETCQRGRDFASGRDFEKEFARRIDHARAIAIAAATLKRPAAQKRR